MKSLRNLLTLIACFALIVAGPVWAEDPPPADAAEDDDAEKKASPVPEEVIEQVTSQMRPPDGAARMSPAEKAAFFSEAAGKTLQLGRAAVDEYPNAENLYLVQSRMLEAAAILIQLERTEEAQARFASIAEDVAESEHAPVELRFAADQNATAMRILKLSATTRPADAKRQAAHEIRELVARYEETDFAAQAMVTGAMLAQRLELSDLKDEYLNTLENDYADEEGVSQFLLQQGRAPFTAELTKLNGDTLTLPDDMEGQVVIVDFWATWCGPCVRSLPHLKEVYEEYRDKGVEIVGISLDKSREKLEDFVEDRQLPWTITFTGKGWEDPTARKYGISGIPAVWVIGKDGKVVSTNARGNLEETLDKALEAE